MAALLFGLETEYAIAGLSPVETCPDKIVQHLVAGARRRLVHLPDLQSTEAFSGNGSRFYVDCGLHPEICTPECSDPWDAVRYIQAGHRTLFDLVSLVGSANWPGAAIMSFRCNVDYGGSHSTWGCHEATCTGFSRRRCNLKSFRTS